MVNNKISNNNNFNMDLRGSCKEVIDFHQIKEVNKKCHNKCLNNINNHNNKWIKKKLSVIKETSKFPQIKNNKCRI